MMLHDADFASSLCPLEESSDEKRCSTHGSADYPTIPGVPVTRRTNIRATNSKRDKDPWDLTESWSCSSSSPGSSVQTHKSDRQEAVWVCGRQWAERKAEGKPGLLQVWSHWRLWWWTLQALRNVTQFTKYRGYYKHSKAFLGIDESTRARQTVFDGVRTFGFSQPTCALSLSVHDPPVRKRLFPSKPWRYLWDCHAKQSPDACMIFVRYVIVVHRIIMMLMSSGSQEGSLPSLGLLVLA